MLWLKYTQVHNCVTDYQGTEFVASLLIPQLFLQQFKLKKWETRRLTCPTSWSRLNTYWNSSPLCLKFFPQWYLSSIIQDNKLVWRKAIFVTHILLYYKFLAIAKKERADWIPLPWVTLQDLLLGSPSFSCKLCKFDMEVVVTQWVWKSVIVQIRNALSFDSQQPFYSLL